MKKVSRLFTGFAPEHYTLFIDPDRDTQQIRGEVTVTGKKKGRPSQRITLHQHGLTVTSATVVKHDKKGDQPVTISRINHHRTLDEVRLHADTLLYPGIYTITLSYKGTFDDSIHGIYPCRYEINGQRKALIATDLESHHAREVLPCVDEPEAKATFELTLASPLHETAISNTLPAKQIEKDGKLLTTFQQTPRMSTYLLNFVYGDMHSRETKTKDGVEVRVWSTKAHSPSSLDFGLDTAKRSIEFFNDYYGVPYPLPKCDLIALPDFTAAAMENWGAITFREPFLVVEPATSSQSSREYTALVINHEMSHQWFGNLVTMKWWDDLWLNESFANVMEYVATDAMFPEWRVWNMAVAMEGLAAFRRDAITSVQAVKQELHHPDEINSLFDPSIVYAKGGRLINMLMQYVGDEDFRKGLAIYFAKHAYGNTIGDDLWAALSEASGKDIAALMNPWLERSGFPVLHVEQYETSLSITQTHFLLDQSSIDKTRLWPVPLLASAPEIPALLTKQHVQVTLKSPEYVRLDQGAVGHYLVHYVNPEHAAAIAGLVDSHTLTEAERLILLSDSGMLARAGTLSFAATLELLMHYADETSESGWDMISLTIADARRFIDLSPELEPAIKKLIRRLIEAEYQRLGWEEKHDEDSQDTKLRATILGLGVYGEHQIITKHALELFEAYKSDPAAVPSELRGIVFGAAVRSAAEGAFDYLLALEEKTTNVDLKQELIGALTVTRSVTDGVRLLERLKDADKVRQHDVDTWLVFLQRNRYTQELAWNWVRDNWKWIEKVFSRDKSFDYFPRYSASAFNTRKLFEEYKAFYEPLMHWTQLKRNVVMGIEELESRITWLERDVAAVNAFFKTINQ
ncbi:MAG TPA: M1 family metallopeptidase [Candidatus Saccharimonadales bacterium]|jgi:aminopeptidase N|nr:M1 family metallopeptidase [Candidatus Saccharimonadales bacterium]